MTTVRVVSKDNEDVSLGMGSATVWREVGLSDGSSAMMLLTNAHVVSGGSKLFVTDPSLPGIIIPAVLLGMHSQADVAVIYITKLNINGSFEDGSVAQRLDVFFESLTPLTPAPLDSFEVDMATAVGFPLDLPQKTRTKGDITLQSFNNRLVFQISAEINPGNSGGALVNKDVWWGIPFAGIVTNAGVGGDLSFCITHAEAISVAEEIVNAYAGSPVFLAPMTFWSTSNTLPFGSVFPGIPGLKVVEVPGLNDVGFGTRTVFVEYNGVIAPLFQWMRLFPVGTYRVTKKGNPDIQIKTSFPITKMNTSFLTIGDAHFTPITEAHVKAFPGLMDGFSLNTGVLVSAVRPDSEGFLHLGAEVLTANGRKVDTLWDIHRAGENPTIVTSQGTWQL